MSLRLINHKFNLNTIRNFNKCSYQFAKVNNDVQGNKLVLNTIIKNSNSAIEAYNYFHKLEKTPNNNIFTKEYKQLPDDSQFIEKHYKNLTHYKELIVGKNNDFADLKYVSKLFLKLSKFKPEKLNVGLGGIEEELFSMQLDQFNQFICDLMITLRLNGGHLFVLDILLKNKQIFDKFENTK